MTSKPTAETEKRLPLWMELAISLVLVFAVIAGAYAVIANYTIERQVRIDLMLATLAAGWLLYATAGRIRARKVRHPVETNPESNATNARPESK